MQSWIRRSLAFVALVAMVVLVMSCAGETSSSTAAPDTASSGSTDTGQAQALLEDRCASCHSLDRVTLASKTEAQWRRTVTQMVAMGAQLTPEEETVLVAYLAKTYGP